MLFNSVVNVCLKKTKKKKIGFAIIITAFGTAGYICSKCWQAVAAKELFSDWAVDLIVNWSHTINRYSNNYYHWITSRWYISYHIWMILHLLFSLVLCKAVKLFRLHFMQGSKTSLVLILLSSVCFIMPSIIGLLSRYMYIYSM